MHGVGGDRGHRLRGSVAACWRGLSLVARTPCGALPACWAGGERRSAICRHVGRGQRGRSGTQSRRTKPGTVRLGLRLPARTDPWSDKVTITRRIVITSLLHHCTISRPLSVLHQAPFSSTTPLTYSFSRGSL